VIPGDVIHLSAFGRHAQNALNDLQVLLRKVVFAKLPHVNEIAIEHEGIRFDVFQIIQKLFGVATISS
jgi:hypothetical protein